MAVKKSVGTLMIITRGLTAGGMERTSVNVASYFHSKGYNVIYFTLFNFPHFFKLHDDIEIIEPKFDREKHNKFIYALKLIPSIRKVIREQNVNFVLGIGEYFNPFTIVATMGLRCKVFVSDRLSPDIKLGLVDVFKKLSYPFADGAISQTNYAAKRLKENTKIRNITVIPNPLNPIHKLQVPLKNQIVTVGRLNPEKGHKYLIEAFSQIENKDWKLMLIGDGVERIILEKQVEELQLTDRVVFRGELRDFSLELSESQIFVLPSLSEGFPNALIEAMSVPLACISSNCVAGPSDIIVNGENGILVEPKNIEQLKNQINVLIGDSELRNKLQNNAINIVKDLNFESIANKYFEFITN